MAPSNVVALNEPAEGAAAQQRGPRPLSQGVYVGHGVYVLAEQS